MTKFWMALQKTYIGSSHTIGNSTQHLKKSEIEKIYDMEVLSSEQVLLDSKNIWDI